MVNLRGAGGGNDEEEGENEGGLMWHYSCAAILVEVPSWDVRREMKEWRKWSKVEVGFGVYHCIFSLLLWIVRRLGVRALGDRQNIRECLCSNKCFLNFRIKRGLFPPRRRSSFTDALRKKIRP
jgi:hypothetical protein